MLIRLRLPFLLAPLLVSLACGGGDDSSTGTPENAAGKGGASGQAGQAGASAGVGGQAGAGGAGAAGAGAGGAGEGGAGQGGAPPCAEFKVGMSCTPEQQCDNPPVRFGCVDGHIKAGYPLSETPVTSGTCKPQGKWSLKATPGDPGPCGVMLPTALEFWLDKDGKPQGDQVGHLDESACHVELGEAHSFNMGGEFGSYSWDLSLKLGASEGQGSYELKGSGMCGGSGSGSVVATKLP